MSWQVYLPMGIASAGAAAAPLVADAAPQTMFGLVVLVVGTLIWMLRSFELERRERLKIERERIAADQAAAEKISAALAHQAETIAAKHALLDKLASVIDRLVDEVRRLTEHRGN